ncbi:nucleoside phosphorylase domain-containing protein [Aspergillus undulatus]|uniref:nucleoside phosphorylase domain-containing protein n=1 Tax=Aspergillus undulatus TaxID=1810928 RepID=UPI003CCCB366
MSPDDYTTGWICALPLEVAAASLVLDATHPPLRQPRRDQNSYILGELAGHNVVVACLPAGLYGSTFAAIGLMVGIGDGVSSHSADIGLGDVVVSQPQGQFSGAVKYDFGKTVISGHFQRIGALNMPPPALLTALAKVQANHMIEGNARLEPYMTKAMMTDTQTGPGLFRRPAKGHDQLYEICYTHEGSATDCRNCDFMCVVEQRPRTSEEPHIHYGTIAYGNQVRGRISEELGILCFEMEAAGLMNHFPCLVVRGISDYADSHKNKEWQRYAALAEAAFCQAFQPDSPNQTVVLHGVAGTGKTQVALAYITMQYLHVYSVIFWLDASIHAHDATAPVRAVRVWLGLWNNDRWLLVYDCYEAQGIGDLGEQNEIYDLKNFLPEIWQAHIIITTTKPGVELGTQVHVKKFRNMEQSLEVLAQGLWLRLG